MSRALLAFVTLASAGPSAAVDLGEREPAVVVVSGLRELGGAESFAEVVDALGQAAEGGTRLRFEPRDDVRLEACLRGRPRASPLACEVWTVLETQPRPAVLLYLAGRRAEGEREVRAGALDPHEVEGAVRGAFERADAAAGPAEMDAIFDALNRDLVKALAWAPTRAASNRGDLEAALRAALEIDFRPRLEAAGLLRAAELWITTRPAGAVVGVNGREVGPVPRDGLRVLGLGTGRHRVEARLAGRRPGWAEVELGTRDPATLELGLDDDHGAGWDALGWVGGGLVAGGVALAVLGAVEADARNRGAHEGPSGLLRVVGTEPRPSLEPSLGAGPTFAGLAAGLGVAGAGLIVSSLVARDAARPPWLEVALALGLGIVASGVVEVGAALDP